MEIENNNLRAYFFQNMYLQGVHSGIQSLHTIVEMQLKYADVDCNCWAKCDCQTAPNTLYAWASAGKTVVILNGGHQCHLQEVIDHLESVDNPYPWSFFKETEDALNGALTNVGIILPERIYAYRKNLERFTQGLEEHLPKLSEWELKLVDIVSSKRRMN